MIRYHNNFYFLRFIAATCVWYGHCYALKGLPEPWGLASTGVAIFFVISGYFITASYLRCNSIVSFVKNRILRLVPALIGVVLFSIFLVGPLCTALSLRDYFSQSNTWNYLRWIALMTYQYDLPGVFSDHANHAVNGSLWTLPHEVRCYGFIALLGFFALLRIRLIVILLVLLWLTRLYVTRATILHPHNQFLGAWYVSNILNSLRLITLFFCGSFLCLYKNHLHHFMVLALGMGLWMVSKYAPIENAYAAYRLLFEDAGLAAIIIPIGFMHVPLLAHFGKYGDLSYGMYLYAFPVQQICLNMLGRSCSMSAFMALSFTLTMLCALASWHWLEKPALRFKS